MKIVINRCFGGFSLSMKAQAWLLERDKSLFEVIERNAKNDNLWSIKKGKQFEQYKATEFVLFDDKHIYLLEDKNSVEFRTHPLLVECVETLQEEADGSYSNLQVIDIPHDDVTIEDYDGMESVHEQHDSWP